MATSRRALLPVLLPLLLLVSLPGTASAPPALAGPVADVAPAAHPPLRVAVANAFEGSMRTMPADAHDGTDRRRLVSRLVSRGAPDVVLLQEVRGTAGTFARLLGRTARAREAGATYDVVGGSALRWSRGDCDGPRQGRYRLLRGAAVLVNEATVAGVLDQGTVRTWGRWHAQSWGVTGRRGFGCAAQPWARLALRAPGSRPVLVSSVHVSPLGAELKQRAVGAVREALADLRAAHPQDRAALGGDLNLTRCAGADSGCRVRVAHARLAAHGWHDALLGGRPTTTGRLEFLYTAEPVRDVWIDACNRAYRAVDARCPRASGFAGHRLFDACQERSLHYGRPGGGCPPRAFRRYYSDHPALVGTMQGLPVTRE